MGWEPGRDEAKYSVAEVEEVIRRVTERAYIAGMHEQLRVLTRIPLNIRSRWEPDTAYDPHDVVFHTGSRWLARAQTASEPSADNGLWLLISDDERPRPATDVTTTPTGG